MVTNYQLYGVETGNPEASDTIVMLHGYLSSSHYFIHIRQRFDKTHRVIALDLLGFGQSPKPKLDYTYADHIQAIHYTIEQLGVRKPFVLLGHSMGALIALRYAVTHGGDLSKLLLFNPPLFTDTSQMIEVHKAAGRRYRVMLYSRGRHLYWLILKLLPRNKSHRRTSLNFSDIISMSTAAREGSYRHILGGATVFQDFRKVTVPTLLVNGQDDRVEYFENLESRELPANVTITTIQSDHHPLVRNVDTAAQVISSYLLK